MWASHPRMDNNDRHSHEYDTLYCTLHWHAAFFACCFFFSLADTPSTDGRHTNSSTDRLISCCFIDSVGEKNVEVIQFQLRAFFLLAHLLLCPSSTSSILLLRPPSTSFVLLLLLFTFLRRAKKSFERTQFTLNTSKGNFC